MKNKNLIKKIIVLSVLSLNFLFLTPLTFAKDAISIDPPKLERPIPGIDLKPINCVRNAEGSHDCSVSWLSDYIAAVYDYALLIGGILAAIVIMAGGLVWLTSGGDAGKVGSAKKLLTGSVVGLILLFSSYLILETINPELVEKKDITMYGAKSVTGNKDSLICCEYQYKKNSKSDERTFCKTVELTGEQNECPERVKVEQGYQGQWLFTNNLKQSYIGVGCGKNDGTFAWKANSCVPELNEDKSDTWLYQTGIQRQRNDASEELVSLINCIREIVPAEAGVISSISDINHIGKLQECNKANCNEGKKKSDSDYCQHSCQSCHYGGGTSANKSYAVDFGDEKNADILIMAGRMCGAKYWLDEGDHVHLSVNPCPKN